MSRLFGDDWLHGGAKLLDMGRWTPDPVLLHYSHPETASPGTTAILPVWNARSDFPE